MGLAEITTKRPDAQEIKIAGRALDVPFRGVVDDGGVIRHTVARLQIQLLKVERVSGRHLREPVAAALEQADALLVLSVDREDQIEVLHAEIVLGPRLNEDFLDRRGLCVATWRREGHAGRLIVQYIDRVLRRGRHRIPGGRRLELDVVETVVARHEGGDHRAVSLDHERQQGILIERHAPAGARHGSERA